MEEPGKEATAESGLAKPYRFQNVDGANLGQSVDLTRNRGHVALQPAPEWECPMVALKY